MSTFMVHLLAPQEYLDRWKEEEEKEMYTRDSVRNQTPWWVAACLWVLGFAGFMGLFVVFNGCALFQRPQTAEQLRVSTDTAQSYTRDAIYAATVFSLQGKTFASSECRGCAEASGLFLSVAKGINPTVGYQAGTREQEAIAKLIGMIGSSDRNKAVLNNLITPILQTASKSADPRDRLLVKAIFTAAADGIQVALFDLYPGQFQAESES